jgi:hypothetical protein
MPPALEQPSGFQRDLPLIKIGQVPPVFDVTADLVDDRGGLVFLLFGRKAIQNRAGSRCDGISVASGPGLGAWSLGASGGSGSSVGPHRPTPNAGQGRHTAS